MSLSRPQIEQRFGRAAADLICRRRNKPVRLVDVQRALDKAQLPITATENNPVVIGLFLWTQCPGTVPAVMTARESAIRYVERIAHVDSVAKAA